MRSKKRRNERRHRPTIPFGAETKRRPVVPRGKSDSHLEAETCQSQTKIGLNTILTSAQGCFVSAEQVLAWRMLLITASRSVSHDRLETKWTQPESSTEGTSTRLRTASLGSSLTQPAPRFQPPVHPNRKQRQLPSRILFQMPRWRFRPIDDFPRSLVSRMMLAGRLRPHGWGRFFLPNVLLVELPAAGAPTSCGKNSYAIPRSGRAESDLHRACDRRTNQFGN